MARTARVKLSGTGVADYHVMSRTNDRRFLFERGETKTQLVGALRRAAEFCGVRLRAYTAMGNHFHVVVRVTRTDVPVPKAELIRRVGVLRGGKAARELERRWAELHAAGFEAVLAAIISVIVLHEVFTGRVLIGCGLVFLSAFAALL